MNPELPNLDIPLLRKTVEWVEEQEALIARLEELYSESKQARALQSTITWAQSLWIEVDESKLGTDPYACATSYCFAGKIAMETGWRPLTKLEAFPHEFTTDTYDAGGWSGYVEKDGVQATPADAACQELGIPEWLVSEYRLDIYHDPYLFSGTNDAAAIREIAEMIAGERL